MRRQLDQAIGVPLLRFLSLFTRCGRNSPATLPRRVLVIKLAAFGDAVVLIPTLRALRRALPDAQIDWLATPINKAAAQLVPYVNRVVVLSSFNPFARLFRFHRGRR